jgi:hypothetical protein
LWLVCGSTTVPTPGRTGLGDEDSKRRDDGVPARQPPLWCRLDCMAVHA